MSWLNLTRTAASPKTTARRLTSLRGFARWAGWGPVLVEYILPTAAKPIAHPIPGGIETVRLMIEAAKNHEQKAIIALGGLVGCRISETRTITTANFNLDENLLTIRGKGDKTRIVPISREALEHLITPYVLAYPRPDQRLISYQDRFARQLVTNLAEQVGVRSHVTSHDLRATFATAALDACGNVRVVQELLGHAQVTTTEIYTSVGLSKMREAIQF